MHLIIGYTDYSGVPVRTATLTVPDESYLEWDGKRQILVVHNNGQKFAAFYGVGYYYNDDIVTDISWVDHPKPNKPDTT